MSGVTFKLGISSVDAITIRPEYDYSSIKKRIESKHRTRSGRMFKYHWSNYVKIGFTLDYIAGGNASVINSWWNSDTELLFFKETTVAEEETLLAETGLGMVFEDDVDFLLEGETSLIPTEVFSVMIINEAEPLKQHVKPYDYYFTGKILLEGY